MLGDNCNIVIRKYEKGDEQGIVELIKREFDPNINPVIDLDVWRWKYMDNPAPIPSIIWVAECDGEIIGHYAINPVVMKWGDKEIIASQVSGIVTRKEYRRRGIFKTLALKSTDEARERGIAIIYVFPNSNSYPLFKKMKWLHVFSLVKMFKILNMKTLLRRYGGNTVKRKVIETCFHAYSLFKSELSFQLPEDITVFDVADRFDNSFDKLWTNVSRYYKYVIKRDSNYLNWRYSHPRENFKIFASEKNGDIAGYVVLKCKISDIKIGYIFDLFCDPNDKDVIRSLLLKSIEYFVSRNMDVIHFCVLKKHPYYKLCKELGFLKWGKIPFVIYNVSEFKDEDFDQRKWLLSYGDREGSF